MSQLLNDDPVCDALTFGAATGDIVQFPAIAKLDNMAAFTVFAWLNPNTLSTNRTIIRKGNLASIGWFFSFTGPTAGGLRLVMQRATTNSNANSTVQLVANKPQCVAGVLDINAATVGRIYIGDLATQLTDLSTQTTAGSGTHSDDSSAVIGLGNAPGGSGVFAFQGEFYFIAIILQVLGQDQLREIQLDPARALDYDSFVYWPGKFGTKILYDEGRYGSHATSFTGVTVNRGIALGSAVDYRNEPGTQRKETSQSIEARWMPLFVSGSTTYSHTGSGGLVFSGAALKSLLKSVVPAGGLQLGGHALMDLVKVVLASGGYSFAGAGTISQKRVPGPSGGLTFGGTSARRFSAFPVPAGGLQFGGAALKSLLKSIVPAGGVQFGGHATSNVKFVVVPVGSLVFGGVAPTSFKGTQIIVGSGGFTLAGAALKSVVKQAPSATGGLSLAGHAPASRLFALVASGGVQLGGSATLARQLRFVMAGGVSLGGTGGGILVTAAIGAFTGVVAIFPQFDGLLAAFAEFDGDALAFAQLGGAAVSSPSFAGSVDIKPE